VVYAKGGDATSTIVSGTANSGNGGTSRAAGGSGIVIIRYTTP
jgi:hypothetical protein